MLKKLIILLLLYCCQNIAVAEDGDKEKAANKKEPIDWGRWGEELSSDKQNSSSEKSDENTLHKLDDSFLLDFEGNKIEEVLEADDQSFETMEIELLNGL